MVFSKEIILDKTNLLSLICSLIKYYYLLVLYDNILLFNILYQIVFLLIFCKGIPTSLYNTGQQWDWHNCWAPLQHVTIFGLEYSKSEKAKTVAFNLAKSWIYTNYVGFKETGFIYEKVS